MRNNTTSKTTKTLKFDLEAEPKKTDGGLLIEISEAPETLERPSLEHRKEEASKPLYLVRY